MKDKVLNIFKRYGNKKLDPILIVKHLKKDYNSNDIKNLLDVLNELVDSGEIVASKKNTYKLVSDEYIKSKVERVQSGNGWLLLKDGDIFIDKRNMKDALTGDVCLCETFKRACKLEARVIRVIERALGLAEVCISDDVVYVKLIKDYPKALVLIENKDISVVDGEIVKLESVKEDKNSVWVRIVEKVGHKNSPDIDTLKIMAELEVPTGFSEEAKEEAKGLPTRVLESDFQGREDLTNEIIFTIDGKDTKDIDDAIGLKILDNGNFLLNVSIADVSRYVKFGGALFNDAYNKGNSTYMADRVEPMLPIELSNGICSLNPNVLRCAVSCEMEIDNFGNFVNKRLFPSIIKSRKKMNYDDVNVILDGGHVDGYEEFESILLDMFKLSKILKMRKLERGEIEFDSSEIKLVVDENGKVTDIKKRVQGNGENLIEEFMIASNESTIEIITSLCDTGIYRVHGRPSSKKIEEFVKFVSALGYKLTGKYDYNNISNRDIQSMMKQLEDVPEKEVLDRKLLRSMQKAIYSTDNIGHFGLGSKKYTHETSPIRRFCDLLIHYLIKIVVFEWDIGVSFDELASGLTEACEHISMTERRSDDCEYAVNDMKIAEYMENHIGEEYDAVVDGLMKNGFFVETENYVDGFVSLDTINDYYILSDDNLCYTNRKRQVALKLGDKVRVKCIAANKETRHVDFVLVDEGEKHGDIK